MYKSKFEEAVGKYLGSQAEYEKDGLKFVQPAKQRTYKPDFKIAENVYIECKGVFSLEDREKMLWVREQHPDKTFLILFYNAYQKLRKGSKTTYADWCDKNGFVWADWYRSGRKLPEEWVTQYLTSRDVMEGNHNNEN